MAGNQASSSDEDEQRAKLLQQQAKNEQLFVIVRKKCQQEQIINEIQQCLNSGAEINAVNTRGKTILDIAYQKEYKELVKFLSDQGGKTMIDVGYKRDNASFTTQHSEVKSYNSHQEMQMPRTLNVEDSQTKQLKLLLLADGKRYLTKDKLLSLNFTLQSGLEIQAIINLLIEYEFDIHYKNPKTKAFAIDIAYHHRYYYSMLLLLEAGSRFPQDLMVCMDALYESNNIPQKLKDFVQNRQLLHHWIQSNKIKEIKNYISCHHLSRYFSSDNKSALETAAEYSNAEVIASLTALNYPLKETKFTEKQSILLQQLNTEGNTLLSIAARTGKSDNVAFLISYGIDVNHRNKYNERAVDLAWANKRYDTVLILLNADSDFPNHFYISELKEEDDDQKALKQFVERRNKFHEMIEGNRIEDVKKCIVLDKSKLYLNSYGQSALFTAIRRKRFAIYAHFKSLGLAFKNEDEEEYVNDLPLDEKDSLKSAMIFEFPQVDKGYILYLISKSRSQKPVENFREHTEKLFKYLDEIPEISIILQVIQYTDYLDIVFDFDNDNIMDINPTATDSTRGTTDYKDGRIYIAAKTDEKQLSGTLAHELTHLAMYMIYKNDCNPFDKGENDRSEAFKIITDDIRRWLNEIIENITGNENNPIVTLATSFLYPMNEQQSELIARVPHIFAQFPRTGKHLFNTKFKSLYEFYTDHRNGGLFNRCREFVKNSFLIKPKNSMQLMNETFGEVNNLIKFGIHFKEPIDLDSFLNSKMQVYILETESTFLGMLSIYESLTVQNKNYSVQDSLFLQFDSYIEKEDEILKLFYSPIGKILCLCYYSGSYKGLFLNVLNTLKVLLSLKCDKKIIFVIREKEKKLYQAITCMFQDNYKEAMIHKFTLNNFTKDCQQMLLERRIKFLGDNIELSKFIDFSDNNSKLVIDTEILIKLIKDEKIEIGRLPSDTSYLEGAYADLFEEIDVETFIDKLISHPLKDFYVISGVGTNKPTNLLNILSSIIEKIEDWTIVYKLKSRIEQLKHHENINQSILIADELFDEKDFQKLCHNNSTRKIYWIHLNHGKELKFVLQKIYSPEFYITGKRFNHEVVIGKNVVEELCNATLADIFIIELKQESEIIRWFQFRSDQKIQFEANNKRRKIRFVPCLHSWEIYYQSQSASLLNQTVHLLEFRQDQLIWHKTYGSINMLIQYRIKDHKNIKPVMDENLVIKTILDTKVTILSGNPGTGKSTSINQMCSTKYILQCGKEVSIIKSHWMIKINLKDHLQAIKKINFLHSDNDESVIWEISEFLIRVVNNIGKNSTKGFAKGLIEIMLRTNISEKPCLIVFDGYDEILDELNRNKITLLLQHLKDKTNAKLCITTRLHYENDLEAALSTFAMRLEPMDNVSVLSLVKQYFTNRFTFLLRPKKFIEIFDNNGEVVSQFADAFLIKMREVFQSDVSSFIGTPLQLYLMLEISLKYFHEKTQEKGCLEYQSADFNYLGHDIWEIYENFVNRKYEIVCMKTGNKEETLLQEHKENFDNYHMDLAKSLLNVKSLVRESFKKFQDIVLSAGIVKSDGCNLDFIHSTFAEYFAAKAFLYWIYKWQKNDVTKRKNFQKQQFFFSKILCGVNYRVIRSFLNVKFLKCNIYNLQLREEYYNSKILFVSAMENLIGIAEFVFTNFSNVNVNACDHNGHTVLLKAAIFVNPEMIQWLIEKGANINAKDKSGQTVLHIVVKFGSLDIIKWLVERGAIVNEKNMHGRSALHEAAVFGRFEIVKWLIENGAYINCKEANTLNALHEVAASGNYDIFQILIENGADINAVTKTGWTFLHTATREGRLDIVKLLIDRGALVNAEDSYGSKVLHEAIRTGNLKIVKYLIDLYPEFKAEAIRDGKNILQIAVAANHLDIIQYVIENDLVDKEAFYL